ncbi:TPA: restriction endonuclease subunit S [Streptococcus suis]|nr:restriction endonuclease subunit S [Streptococcus suis]
MSFSEWREVELEEVIELVIDYRGKTPKKLGGDWSQVGYRALSAKNIKTGRIVQEDAIRYLDSNLYTKWMKEEVNRGDILMTSEAPFGELLYWDSDEKIVLSQRLFCLRTNKKVDSKYLYYYMTTNRFQKELDARATGTTVRGLRQPQLLKCKIEYPPIKDQEAIANILSSMDEKIRVNNQINKTLENMAQAIFKQWFVDFEFPNEDGEPYKSSGGEMVESELGMIPKGWEVKDLGEIIDIHDSKRIPLSKNEREKREKIYPYYGAASLMDYVDEYIFDGIYVLLGEDGTVVNEDGSPVLQYVWGKFWVNNHAHVLSGKKGVSINYLYILLSNLNVSGAITGAVQLKINQKNLKELKIIMPNDMKIVSQFSEIVDKSFEKTRVKSDENKCLVLLRDSLLPKLMSGEIRVPLDEEGDAS